MASKFYAGMKNVVEALNEMWAAFAAGPYNALPLTGGTIAGSLVVRDNLQAGPGPVGVNKHQLYKSAQQSGEIFAVGRAGMVAPCIGVNGSDGSGGWAGSLAVLYVGKNSLTSASIRAGGTINASGADYAEYLIKSLLCGTIIPGQIVGIDTDGKLTDKWDRAIAFVTKSTAPCLVGGDSWSQSLGMRPPAPARTSPDISDAEWAATMADHAAAETSFDAALERLRQTVDRIAFAGQVPVNVLGAAPGQYIVPVQDGEGIAGLAVDRGDMTLNQYMSAIGRVIAIEDDGRARIIVKVA